jgi:hypothetical protein
MANEASWHLLTAEGEQMGPYTDDELRTFADEERITPESQLWMEGMEDWVPAAQVEGLFPDPQPNRPMLLTGAIQPATPAPVAASGYLLSAPYSQGGSPGMHPTGATIDPVFVRPLRAVALGLSFLLWGTWCIVIGLVLAAFGVLWVFLSSESTLALVVLLVAGALALVGYILKIIGASISINVPSASGAKGFIIASLSCEVVGLLVSLLGLPVGGWFSMAGLILIAVFLRKLAAFTNNILFAIEGKSLIIHSSILTGLSILAPIIMLLVVGTGVLVGTATGSGGAGFGIGAILLLILILVSLFFLLSVILKSLSLFRGLRDAIKRGCFATIAAQGQALG